MMGHDWAKVLDVPLMMISSASIKETKEYKALDIVRCEKAA